MTPYVIIAVGLNRRAQNGDKHPLVSVALEDHMRKAQANSAIETIVTAA